MRLLPASVRARLTLLYTIILGVPLIVFAAASYLVLRHEMAHRAEQSISDASDVFVSALADEAREQPHTAAAIRTAIEELRLRDVRVAVYDVGGHLIDSSRTIVPRANRWDERGSAVNLARLGAALLRRGAISGASFHRSDREGGALVAVRRLSLGRDSVMVAAVQALNRDAEVLEVVRTSYLIAIPLLLILAAASGWVLARRSLSPIVAMSRRAEEISATNLHERLPVQNPHDELGGLATMVNGLIGRLDRAFEQQRRFMADASHELRTPVALVRAETDVALDREHRTETEYREALEVVRDGARRLTAIVDDIFLLARADAGRLPVQRGTVYLDEIVTDAARAVRSLAAKRSIVVDVRPLSDAPVVGDAELLGRLLLNLLDNAIKYSPPSSRVVVTLSRDDGHYTIAVRDSGPGVGADARPHIFERFHRADRARSRGEESSTSGAGLGLSIARWIAEEHGGSLDLAWSDERGSEFRAIVPVRGGNGSSTSRADPP